MVDAAQAHMTCANCGAELTGQFCAACGQNAHLHRTLGGMLHDIAHGVLHFEGKLGSTLPLLATRPGELTRRYIHGQRMRFVSPIALFLMALFIMFGVMGLAGDKLMPHVGVPQDAKDIAAERQHLDKQIAVLEQSRRERAQSGASTVDIDRELGEARDAREALDIVATLAGKPDALVKTLDQPRNRVTATLTHALENPSLLLFKLQTKAYKYAWALIPLSLPFMWLLFPTRRHIRMYDHAVFVTYSLSAVMLLLSVMGLLAWAGVPAGWLMLALPVHFFLQLRGAYKLSAAEALWRTLVLLCFAFVALVIFVLLIVALGLM